MLYGETAKWVLDARKIKDRKKIVYSAPGRKLSVHNQLKRIIQMAIEKRHANTTSNQRRSIHISSINK